MRTPPEATKYIPSEVITVLRGDLDQDIVVRLEDNRRSISLRVDPQLRMQIRVRHYIAGMVVCALNLSRTIDNRWFFPDVDTLAALTEQLVARLDPAMLQYAYNTVSPGRLLWDELSLKDWNYPGWLRSS